MTKQVDIGSPLVLLRTQSIRQMPDTEFFMRRDYDDHLADYDLTDQFWGDQNAAPVTGAIRAIKDGLSTLRPHTVDDTSGIKRTRSHGIPRPSNGPDRSSAEPRRPRKPVAENSMSIAELASGQLADRRAGDSHPVDSHSLDAWSELDDWSELDELTARHRAVQTSLQHRQMVDHDRLLGGEVDSGWDDEWNDEWEVIDDGPFLEGRSRRPLAVRAGGAALVTLALLPFAFRKNDGSSGSQAAEPISAVVVADTASDVASVANDPTSNGLTSTDSPSADGSVDQSGVGADSQATATAASEAQPTADTSSEADSSDDADTASGSKDLSSSGSQEAETLTDNMTSQVRADEADDDGGGEADNSADGGEADKLADGGRVDKPAERVVPDCSRSYKSVAGDSWHSIATRADITPKELMRQNNATADTVILVGDKICLPADATDPATADNAEADESNTKSSSTSSDTAEGSDAKSAPTTTAAPAKMDAPPPTVAAKSPAGSPGRSASSDEVIQIIRDVFPDDIEDQAIEIARRESKFQATADNGSCCYGVFQIHWTAHQNWLDDLGINSKEDLFDPLLNTQAALVLHGRAGNSFNAWSTS